MNFFGSSLAMANNLKVAFLGKKFSHRRIAPLPVHFYIWYQMLQMGSAVESKISILLRGLPKEQVQSATKISNCRSQLNTAGQCQIYWEADPQTSAQVSYTASAQNSGTVPQDWQLFKAWTNYQTYIWIVGFFFQKCHFWVISDVQWWKQISTHFSDSTD